MGQIADVVLPSARLVLQYADMLCKEIPAEQFGLVPRGVVCNSPAYNIGHIALYADMACGVLGRADLARDDGRWKELFSFKSKSEEDATGARYGGKEELLARFRDRQEAAMKALAQAGVETLGSPNPREAMRDRFPTVGAMAVFMLTAHPMGHLGQISTWRRCMGMPMIF